MHHEVYGIMAMLVSGAIEFAYRPQTPGAQILGALFGAGAALTLDEFALWLHLEDVYWAREGRKSVDAVFVAAAAGLFLLISGNPFSNPGGESHLVFGLALGVNLLLCLGAILKGKTTCGIVGLFVPFVALVGCLRLAKPHSPWARWRYRPHSRSARRALRRYPPGRRTPARRPEGLPRRRPAGSAELTVDARARGSARRADRGADVVADHGGLQFQHSRAQVDAQVIGQAAAHRADDGQRVGRSARPVQRQREAGGDALPVRVRREQGREFRRGWTWGGSAWRSRRTIVWTWARAVFGGSWPHSPSTNPSTLSGRLFCRSSSASAARGPGAAIVTCSPSSATKSGPRMLWIISLGPRLCRGRGPVARLDGVGRRRAVPRAARRVAGAGASRARVASTRRWPAPINVPAARTTAV